MSEPWRWVRHWWSSRIKVRYVDPANGSDTNDGLSWVSAMATIQVAHDDLPKRRYWRVAALTPGDTDGEG